MQYIQIKANLVSNNKVQLNDFLGSTIRGALISEISRLYCTYKEQDCKKCVCGMTCPNKTLFNMKEYTSDNQISNTIVINTHKVDDTNISVDIKLLGIGMMSAETIKDILKSGILLGKEREPFTATSIHSEICETDIKNFRNVNRLTIHFKSPTYIQRYCQDLTFEEVIRSCMYRYMAINKITESEQRIDFEKLKDLSTHIRLVNKRVEAVELQRYSTRTKYKHTLNCFKGSITFEGDLEPFLPVIELVSNFNIGKWSSMGLGNISYYAERKAS